MRLAACWLAAVLWTAGSLWYRVLEVPGASVPFDVAAYEAGMPRGKANRAGELVEAAGREFPDWARKVRVEMGPMTEPAFPGYALPESWSDPGASATDAFPPDHYSYWSQLHYAVRTRWPGREGQLGRWLERMCQGPWMQDLEEAARLPTGVVAVPREIWTAYPYPERLWLYARIGELLHGRASRLEHRGQLSAALEPVATALALSRNLSNRAESTQFDLGREIEGDALEALTPWALGAGQSAALLRRGLDELRRHVREAPPLSDAVKADYLIQVVRLSHLRQLPEKFTPYRQWGVPVAILDWALQVPWERARLRRIVNWVIAQRLHGEFAEEGWTPGEEGPFGSRVYTLVQGKPWAAEGKGRLSLLRRTELVLALRLYQVEHDGRPARSLEELMPAYLPEVPVDPVTEKPFVYYVSRGEELTRMAVTEVKPGEWKRGPQKVRAAPGQAVLVWDRDRRGEKDFLLLPTGPRGRRQS